MCGQSINEIYHDMGLDSLHDVGKEPFALLDKTVLPHLVCHKADEVSREQDLLAGSRVSQTGCRDLEATD